MCFWCFSIREVAQSHHSMEQELAHAVNASSKAMDVVYAKSSGVGWQELPSQCPVLISNVQSDIYCPVLIFNDLICICPADKFW